MTAAGLDATGPVVLWDLDGTLVRLRITLDDVRRWKGQLGDRFAAHGWLRPLSPMLPSLEAALDAIGADLPAPERDRLREQVYDDLDRWEQDALTGIDLLEPAAGTFAGWRRLGVASAIVTNNGRRAALDALDVLRSSGHLEGEIVLETRESGRPAKPDPACLVAALKRLGEDSLQREIVFLGDGSADWAAAATLAAQRSARIVALRPDGEGLAWGWPQGTPQGPTPEEWLQARGLGWGAT